MKLYGTSLSPYAGRVALVLRARGSDLPLHAPPVSGPEREAFLAINPQGKIPFLDDDGFYLSESAVIADYLDGLLPGPSLWPQEPKARAREALLARFVDIAVAPGVAGYTRSLLGPVFSQEKLDESWAQLASGIEAIEHYRDATSAWLNGDRFGHADAALLPVLYGLYQLGVPTSARAIVEAHPALEAYWQRANAEPFVAAVFADAATRAAFIFGEGGPLNEPVKRLRERAAQGGTEPSAHVTSRFDWYRAPTGVAA